MFTFLVLLPDTSHEVQFLKSPHRSRLSVTSANEDLQSITAM